MHTLNQKNQKKKQDREAIAEERTQQHTGITDKAPKIESRSNSYIYIYIDQGGGNARTMAETGIQITQKKQ